MDDTEIVGTYDEPTEARIDANSLEDAGIDVEVLDERTVAADPLLASAVGGIKLRVRESDAPRAREILRGDRDGTLEDGTMPDAEIDEEEWEELTSGLQCPECGTDDIGLEPVLSNGWILLTVVVVLALVFGTNVLAGSLAGLWLVVSFVAQWALIIRKFPLACKECQHAGLRDEFDPTTEL